MLVLLINLIDHRQKLGLKKYISMKSKKNELRMLKR